MENANDIFTSLKVFLMDVAEEKNILTENEVKQEQATLLVYQLVLKNFDGLFSLLRDKQSKLTIDEKIAQLT